MKLTISLFVAIIASTSAYAQKGPTDSLLQPPTSRDLLNDDNLTSAKALIPHPGLSHGSRRTPRAPTSREKDSRAEKNICSNC